MPLFSIDLSEEFQSFLIVEALSAAIGIGVITLLPNVRFGSALSGFPVFGRRFHRKDLHCVNSLAEIIDFWSPIIDFSEFLKCHAFTAPHGTFCHCLNLPKHLYVHLIAPPPPPQPSSWCFFTPYSWELFLLPSIIWVSFLLRAFEQSFWPVLARQLVENTGCSDIWWFFISRNIGAT